MFNLRRMETIPLPRKVENAYSLEISQTGHISITTSTFLLIYHITPNRENAEKEISCRKYIIPPPTYTLKDDLRINIKTFIYDLPQEQYYECILAADLTPDLDIVQPYVPKYIKSFWSPPHCDKNFDCVLATLANNGVVEIYAKTYHKNYNSDFTHVCNVTQKYTDILKDTWRDVQNESCTAKLEELLSRANQIKVKCIAWSSYVSEGYHLLILAHLSANITFWKVSLHAGSTELNVDFLCAYQTDLDYITSLNCKRVNNEALLFVGSKDGRVHALSVTSSNELNVEKGYSVWSDKDTLKVNSVHLMNTKFGNFMLLVKASLIIIISLDKPLENYEFACNNIEILDIVIIENYILILTKTGVVKEIILSLGPSGINIKWRHFYVDINTYMKCPIGMVVSKNKMLFFILARQCKPKQSKCLSCNVDLHIFCNNENKCLEYLLNFPSKQLTYMWDCLELYRCLALQTKNLLLQNIQFEKHYDKYDFYTLKIFLYVSNICKSLSDQLKYVPPIKFFDEVFAIFHLKMIVARMQHLLELYKANGHLSTFQHQNLLVLSNYIRQIIVEDMAKVLDLSDPMMDTITKVMQIANNINHENDVDHCILCEEKLYDITCMPPHFDTRCIISLMQIKGVVKYKCLLCNSVVHDEIAKEVRVIVCPFCDVPMIERLEKREMSAKREIEHTLHLAQENTVWRAFL